MASFAALGSRRRSTTQYQASWLEHRVRQVSRRIRPVTPLPFLPVAQVQFISCSGNNVRFHLQAADYGINGDYEEGRERIRRTGRCSEQFAEMRINNPDCSRFATHR